MKCRLLINQKRKKGREFTAFLRDKEALGAERRYPGVDKKAEKS